MELLYISVLSFGQKRHIYPLGVFMNHQLTLYHYWRSSCSWRVRWALAHKGITYRTVAVELKTNEQLKDGFLKLNPMGTVPCLIVDGNPLNESMAILEWLEEEYPERPLLPSDPLDRAWVRQFCQGIVAGTQPMQNLIVLKHFSSDESEQRKWAQYWIARGLAACERLLENRGGIFCLKDQLTLADLCLIPQFYNANRFGAAVEPYPKCRRVYEHCLTVDSCIASSPEHWQNPPT